MTGSSGRFRPVLVSLLLLGLAGQVAMLSEFQRKHPAAVFPWHLRSLERWEQNWIFF